MKRLVAFLLFLLLAIFGIAAWWINGTKAANALDTSQKLFVIEKGEGVREIGNSLKREGLIRDPVVFFLLVKKERKDKSIQAGDYRLSSSMNLRAIVSELTHGTLDIWVTFPEGLRAEEVAEILKKNFKQYNVAWQDELKKHEGYLFPDTYLIPKNADIRGIISIISNNFNKKIKELSLDANSSSARDVVILASLIEREAKTNEEKPVIAGILTNRLKAGMPLQVDATIQYAKGYDSNKKTWWSKVYIEDYKGVKSPYNTYLFTGLPPAPIASPGKEALEAAINPKPTDHFYYIHDEHGKIYYAKTEAEHVRNVEKYIK